ncbi:MAG: hypothetical protein R8P61_31790 [Bacteroidia bacterium]|nr:hypothetical protein [Bacteroidia bacterium]
MKHMKNLFCLLLCGLLLSTACHQLSEETFQVHQQESQPSTLSIHLQDIADKLDNLTPSEQVFLEELHHIYPQIDQFLKEGNAEDILRLKKIGRIKILEGVNIQNRKHSVLLDQGLKAFPSEELFPSYQKEVSEGYQSWSCKEWCIIRAEHSRLSSMNACTAGKGDEHECKEEAEIRYFYFLTECMGDC